MLALLAGLIAAGYWYFASQVQLDLRRGIESGEAQATNRALATATMEAFSRAAHLNRVAALWTGAAGLFAGIAAITGWFV